MGTIVVKFVYPNPILYTEEKFLVFFIITMWPIIVIYIIINAIDKLL